MKKILSVLLSLVLCASVIVTNPPIEIGDNLSNPPQNEQSEEDGDELNPCSDSGDPGGMGEIQS